MRIRPSLYTITTGYPYLKSWVVESSLDGHAWAGIDRKSGADDFRDAWATASYLFRNQPNVVSSA
jgi:hypothetical protein